MNWNHVILVMGWVCVTGSNLVRDGEIDTRLIFFTTQVSRTRVGKFAVPLYGRKIGAWCGVISTQEIMRLHE